jgi:hypothetical protein
MLSGAVTLLATDGGHILVCLTLLVVGVVLILRDRVLLGTEIVVATLAVLLEILRKGGGA